jgi:hypothetical protein
VKLNLENSMDRKDDFSKFVNPGLHPPSESDRRHSDQSHVLQQRQDAKATINISADSQLTTSSNEWKVDI